MLSNILRRRFCRYLVASALSCATVGATSARAESITAGTQATGLTAVDLFRLADQALLDRRIEQAESIYRTLTADPNAEVRAEARFRLGMMLAANGRHHDAALSFRALLDEKPDAARVRLELARVLAQIGDEGSARRQLRQLQATGGLPSEVALVVDQFAGALRALKPWGGSFSIAIAPDTNINRATNAKTLDTVIAPLDLSEDAQERSGLGLRVGGQTYLRLPLAEGVTLLPRASAEGELYREGQFNDMSASAVLGVELILSRNRLRPSVGATWRRYGSQLYASTQTASVNWLHMIGSKAQLEAELSVSRADYMQNDLQDGWLYNLGATI